MTGPLEDIHGMIAGENPMADDLVKRLRANDLDECYEAADRIEALEAQLAEAVAALQFYAGPHEYPSEGPWGLNSQDFGAKAAVALHKITKAD